MGLLALHDMERSSQFMKELCVWCQEDVSEARKAGYLDSYQENKMHNTILEFRASMDGMYDYIDQPPHFFYVHFLVLLSALYLPLFAIDTAFSTGWGDECILWLDILNGIIVLLQCIFVVGLRSLGTHMIDPYGDDYEDLCVVTYVESTLDTCNTIMNIKRSYRGLFQPPVDKVPEWHKNIHGSTTDESSCSAKTDEENVMV